MTVHNLGRAAQKQCAGCSTFLGYVPVVYDDVKNEVTPGTVYDWCEKCRPDKKEKTVVAPTVD